jgi:hypothetical protein
MKLQSFLSVSMFQILVFLFIMIFLPIGNLHALDIQVKRDHNGIVTLHSTNTTYEKYANCPDKVIQSIQSYDFYHEYLQFEKLKDLFTDDAILKNRIEYDEYPEENNEITVDEFIKRANKNKPMIQQSPLIRAKGKCEFKGKFIVFTGRTVTYIILYNKEHDKEIPLWSSDKEEIVFETSDYLITRTFVHSKVRRDQ